MPKCVCAVCGREIYKKPSRIKSNKMGIACSLTCSAKLRQQFMKGENNHQYGLKGELNSSFKSSKRVTNYGYVKILVPGHPYADRDGRVLEHRFVVESNYHSFDSMYFEEINGWIVLKKIFDVHHIDENKLNNDITNLKVILRSEHTTLHNKNKKIIRDEKGRIVTVVKVGKNKIFVKLCNGGILPVRKTPGAAGYDCYANEDIIIKCSERKLVKLGFALQMPTNMCAYIIPRSGLSRDGIDVAIGLIDSDFRAEISANVINNRVSNPDFDEDGDCINRSDFVIHKGDRICQIVFREVPKITFIEVDELDPTERGTGGFGHTGVR